jgi:hypothetical protein
MNILLGDEMELSRQLGEMNMLEDFLKYAKQGDATHFLFSWSRHQLFRSELHDFKHFRDDIDVQLDLKVRDSLIRKQKSSYEIDSRQYCGRIGWHCQWQSSQERTDDEKDWMD